VRGPNDQVLGVLRGTDGVAQVTPHALGDGLTQYEVRTRNNQDLRETISQRLMKNNWPIRRLDLSRRRLEDRFMEVLREQDPLQSAPAPAPSHAVQPPGSVTAPPGQ
jgi:hypothetical protein